MTKRLWHRNYSLFIHRVSPVPGLAIPASVNNCCPIE